MLVHKRICESNISEVSVQFSVKLFVLGRRGSGFPRRTFDSSSLQGTVVVWKQTSQINRRRLRYLQGAAGRGIQTTGHQMTERSPQKPNPYNGANI